MKEKGFNRGAYMAVITVITVCSIFLGSLIHLGGLLWRIPGLSALRPGPAGEGTVSGVETLESFGAAKIELDAGTLTIVKGTEYSLEFDGYPSGKTPQCEYKGDTLVITQKMGRGFNLKSMGNLNCSVTLTIPEDINPNMDIKLALGGVDISDLAFGTMVLDLDMGSCVLSDCSMSGCTVDADMGSCTFTNCSMFGCNMDADMGEITLKNCSFTDGTFDADMGNIKLTDAAFTSAECNADMGNVEVSGSFTDLKADCSMGSVKVTTDKGSENASMDLKTDMGKVTVNGENRGSEYKK